MSNREKLKAKIAALRAKTIAAGCTEAEAGAAAELAARLLQDHGLSEAELGMSEASSPEETLRGTWRTKLSSMIAHCTNTASIHLQADGQVLFIGEAPGPDVAVYLRDICFRAVDREAKTFKDSKFYRSRRTLKTRRAAVADFTAALVNRLCHRLLDTFGPAISEKALLAAQEHLDSRFPESVPAKISLRETRFVEAANAGWRAGGDVALNRGVGGDAAPLALEGRK